MAGPAPSAGDAPARPASRIRPANVPMPALAGIRGLAAVGVLVYHVASTTGLATTPGPIADLLSPLPIVAVGIFIGMSGLFLFHPMSYAHLAGVPHRPTSVFLARRLGRIYPAYWFALLGLVVLFRYREIHGAEWLPILTLTHVYVGLEGKGLFVSWTVAVELSFYLFLPCVFWVIRRAAPVETTTPRQRLRVQFIVVGLMYLLGLLFRTAVLLGPHSWLVHGRYLFFNFLDGFGGGMIFAIVLSWRQIGNPLPSWFQYFVERPWVCLVFAVELYWVGTRLGIPPGLVLGPLPPFRLLIFAVSLLLLIPMVCLPGIFDEHGTARYHRVFASTPLLWLGGISYGIYLWHLGFVVQFEQWVREDHFPAGFWPLAIASFVCSAIAAAVSYFLVEQPALRLIKRRLAATGRTVPAHGERARVAAEPPPTSTSTRAPSR